jgi:hypothetical protein
MLMISQQLQSLTGRTETEAAGVLHLRAGGWR